MSKIIINDIDWMRNDYAHCINIGGVVFPTVEHAYQGAKFSTRFEREHVAKVTMHNARRLGKEVNLPSNWNNRRATVMEGLIRQKFNDKVLGERLAKTGVADIVMESQNEFWGAGKFGNGKNNMGKILEGIRSECQFVLGIDPEDKEEIVPDLADAISNRPDRNLAKACQDVYSGLQGVMTLIDRTDFDADFISRRANIPYEVAVDAIDKVKVMQSSLTRLQDLLETPSNEYCWLYSDALKRPR